MNSMPKELKDEYEYLMKQNADIEGVEHPLINVSDTLRAYFILADYFTDPSSGCIEKMLVGVRDFGLLESALGRQYSGYASKKKYNSGIDICATLFFGLVKNHSFSDGNKRTALLILIYQLNLYGYIPVKPKKEFEKLVVAVAANRIPDEYDKIYKKCKKKGVDDPIVSTISMEIKSLVAKKDHTYHTDPTMREFCNALEKQGVKCKIAGNAMHFERNVKRRCGLVRKEVTLKYSIAFAGMTRGVGPQKARATLEHLEIYDQYANYNDFLNGKEMMYSLVEEFAGPLRRLKDK